MSRSIAITGAGGFIGQALLARHLAAGDRVRVLSRGQNHREWPAAVSLHQGDLAQAEPESLAAFVDGADVLYHAAAELLSEPRMPQVNVAGTNALLQAAAGRIGRWVQLSSIGVYGPRASGVVTEQTAPQPASPYEQTKWQADLSVIEAAEQTRLQTCILRPSIVFGPGMKNTSFPALVRAIAAGRFFFLGPRGAILPLVHVADVVEALVRCGSQPRAAGQVFNWSENCPLEDFVAETLRLTGRTRQPWRLPLPLAQAAAATLGRLPGFPLTRSRVAALTSQTVYPADHIARTIDFTPVLGWRAGLAQWVRSLELRG